MQASIALGMEDALLAVLAARPWSILDVGVGFGTWGQLFRQYLDVWHGRFAKPDWIARVDGIEIEQSRVLPHVRYIYDDIVIGPAQRVVPLRAAEFAYDVIFFGDVLEHIPKQSALRLLSQSVRLARSRVVVRIPLGLGWRTEAEHDADEHRSLWDPDDFVAFGATLRQYDYHGHAYALAEINKRRGPLPRLADIESKLCAIERAAAAALKGSSP